jgi:hypothetical protein
MFLTDFRRLRPIMGGMKQFVCGYSPKGESVGANSNARYCYSVWLRHLTAWRRAGFVGRILTVAELGPGDSVGTGIAALLSGVERYYALDVVAYSNTPTDLVEQIAELYRRGEDIPGDDEFPELKPKLSSYKFPRDVLSIDDLRVALSAERVHQVGLAVSGRSAQPGGLTIQYFVPWNDESVIQPASVDAAFSQAVMEHVNDIETTYRALSTWLRDGACMSHQIDFRSHGMSTEWNGHWAYPDWIFRIARGRRPYLLNRQPKSAHLRAIREAGFQILSELPVSGTGGITRGELARRFRELADEDLSTAGLFVVAQKRSQTNP